MSSFAENFVGSNIYPIQQVITVISVILLVIIFGLGVSLIVNTVVTQNDLLLGTVVSDSDRSNIKAITGISLTVLVLQIIKGVLLYRFH